ncbi:MAG TPA: Eco57I restriction-modification methylase domain-containing protein [Chthoniobacteraceae bacterium]|jgi:hypothetical protein|nr:Eco57I restriction-modification methylase domain-containing protein [Chthoniobacteraceae bacterium]
MTPADLQKILAAPFDRERWLDVVYEVLPSAVTYLEPQSITPDATRAAAIWQLGEITLGDEKNLAILEVEAGSGVDLSRNRAGLRALAARFIDQARYHGVLAVFRTAGQKDWRLTLAARQTIFDEAASDFATYETAPRRYTYLLGPNEICRTPAERLLALRARGSGATLENIIEAFSVEQLNKEFFRDYCDVFNLIATELEDRFPEWKVEDATRDLAQQEAQILLNRLLFLYFVQRKGWLHRDARYLVSCFREHHETRGKSSSYYEDFLFPVFRILSTEWSAREKSVSHLPDHNPNRHDLPFLNGGLFHDDDMNDDASRRRKRLAIQNSTFARVFDGLLERYNFTIREDSPLDQEVAIDPEMLGKIFEELILREESGETGGKSRRHDTGSHYTPRPIVHYLCRGTLAAWLENQPPMAGRTDASVTVAALLALDAAEGLDDDGFQKLRGLISPDDARQLLDSLIRLRACDPAVGSGAFPIGLLHELLNLARLGEMRARGHDPVGGDLAWAYDTKKRFIQHTLYGVDIQERATEICKLRLWLSLMVDHDLGVDTSDCNRRSFQSALRKLEPLPNLDFKIRRANSLVDMIHGHVIELRNLSGDAGGNKPLHQLASAKIAFFNARKQEEKRKLRSEIYESLAELGLLEIRWRKVAAGLELPTNDADIRRLAEMKAAETELAHAYKLAQSARSRAQSAATREGMLEKLEQFFGDPARPTFVWQLDFAEVFQGQRRRQPGEELASVQMDNTRGGFDLLMGNPPYVRIQTLMRDNPQLAAYFKHRYFAASKGNYDLYVVFVERGLELLSGDGQLGYILPHKFFNAQYGEPLRELLSNGKRDERFAHPGHHLRHIVHFGDQQIFPGATNYVCLLFLTKAGAKEVRFAQSNGLAKWLRTFEADSTTLPSTKFDANEWNVSVGRGAGYFDELAAIKLRLEDVTTRIFQGLKTSGDKVYIVEEVSRRGNLVRVYSRQTEKEHDLDAELLHPLVKGGHSHAFALDETNLRILFPYAAFNGEDISLVPEEVLKSRFRATWNYLRTNYDFLSNREDGKMQRPGWYAYIYPKALDVISQPKLFTPDIAPRAAFSYDPTGEIFFTGGAAGGYGLVPKEPATAEFLLGILNSRVSDFYHHRTAAVFRGGWYSYEARFIRNLPIPSANDTQRTAIERLVGYLLFLHRQPTVRKSTPLQPRDPLVAQYFEQWVNAMVYQLFFPEELHRARLDFFELFIAANLRTSETLSEEGGIAPLRKSFERLYDPAHPLRGALFALESLDLVRIIEGEK